MSNDDESQDISRHARRKDDLPKTPIAFMAEIARRNGLWALVSAILIYFLAITLTNNITEQGNKQEQTLFELRMHAIDSAFYARQQCINTAVLAGTEKALCEPPSHGAASK